MKCEVKLTLFQEHFIQQQIDGDSECHVTQLNVKSHSNSNSSSQQIRGNKSDLIFLNINNFVSFSLKRVCSFYFGSTVDDRRSANLSRSVRQRFPKFAAAAEWLH